MQNKSGKVKRTVLNIIKALAVPLFVWALFEIILLSTSGTGVITNSADVKTFFRNLISSLAFALAISTNLSSGRMDLSLGAQMYVGVIFGGNIATSLNLGGVGVLVLSMIIGGICGLVTGLLFVNMRILPMVLGLGITLIFECVSFSVNNQQGIILYGKEGVDILSSAPFIIAIVAVLIIVTTFLFQFSGYGFKYRAIMGNQKLASDAGINIYSNCVISYVIAGALVAVAGVFMTAYGGSLAPVLGMTSNASVFTNMFPMVLGMWIGSIVNHSQIGVLMGAISVNVLSIALSKLGLSSNVQSVIVYGLFLLFVVFNTNKWRVAYSKKRRQRIAEAVEFAEQKRPKALA